MNSTLESIFGVFSIIATVILVRWNFLLLKERRKLMAEMEDLAALERAVKAGVVLDKNELWGDMESWRRERVE